MANHVVTRQAAGPEANPSRIPEIRRRLLAWYESHRRDLPWRGETDPYRILVSEVMLQQTGVDRVRLTYLRFIEQFPSFLALAGASRQDVLLAWAGLGYNRRAVYLHECATVVAREHGGTLPRDPDTLSKLPGIGPYTLAALRSFAFHEDVAALDTNVRRVVSRLELGGEANDRDIGRAASALMPTGLSATWNQALMDFGSLQCTASRPPCLLCPLAEPCTAAPIGVSGGLTRKVAERGEPFVGSRRFYRGKLVARLRELSPGTLAPVLAVAQTATANLTADDERWLTDLARALAADGLARIVETSDGVLVGPPI
jgi:A/G-specific adenine glycosylase